MATAVPLIAAAFPISVMLGLLGFLLAIPGGLALAFLKMSRSWVPRWVATLYVDVVRGTPLFLQILLVYFGLPLIPAYQHVVAFLGIQDVVLFSSAGSGGIDGTTIFRGLLVLSLNSSAYMAEIFRAGIQSIPRGQAEAARSLGMSAVQTMMFVILPQTVRRILPTMMSEFILLYKDTALLAAVSVGEMTLRAKQITAVTYNQSPYIVAAIFYLLVTIPLGRLVARLENRLAVQDSGVGGKRPPRVGAEAVDSEHVIAHSERDMVRVGER